MIMITILCIKVLFNIFVCILAHTPTHTAQTVITQSLPSNLSIQIGDTATLPCTATTPISNAQLLYNWTKDGLPLSVGGRLSYPTPGGAGGSITISPVQSSDAGSYQCTVYTQLVNSYFPPIALPTAACLLTVSGKPHTHTHTHTHTHIHIHIYTHNTIHMQTHIHIHILIYMHTYT